MISRSTGEIKKGTQRNGVWSKSICPHIDFVLSYCLGGICMLYKLDFNSFYRFAFHLLFKLPADFNTVLRNKIL